MIPAWAIIFHIFQGNQFSGAGFFFDNLAFGVLFIHRNASGIIEIEKKAAQILGRKTMQAYDRFQEIFKMDTVEKLESSASMHATLTLYHTNS